MQLKWEADPGFILLNGTLYKLKQCHWHSSSEHTINGKRFDLEVHLVHESATGNIAVTGILYRIGAPDPFLSSVKYLKPSLGVTRFYTDYISNNISRINITQLHD